MNTDFFLKYAVKSTFAVSCILLLLIIDALSAAADKAENYDLNTEVIITGVITDELARQRGPRIFMLQSGDALYQMHTGPWWYLEQIGLTIAKGMEVEVTGSKLYDRKGVLSLIIYNLKDLKSGKTYPFRDDNFTPLWRGQGRRHGRHQLHEQRKP